MWLAEKHGLQLPLNLGRNLDSEDVPDGGAED